jgi:hypothetical protein
MTSSSKTTSKAAELPKTTTHAGRGQAQAGHVAPLGKKTPPQSGINAPKSGVAEKAKTSFAGKEPKPGGRPRYHDPEWRWHHGKRPGRAGDKRC